MLFSGKLFFTGDAAGIEAVPVESRS